MEKLTEPLLRDSGWRLRNLYAVKTEDERQRRPRPELPSIHVFIPSKREQRLAHTQEPRRLPQRSLRGPGGSVAEAAFESWRCLGGVTGDD